MKKILFSIILSRQLRPITPLKDFISHSYNLVLVVLSKRTPEFLYSNWFKYCFVYYNHNRSYTKFTHNVAILLVTNT